MQSLESLPGSESNLNPPAAVVIKVSNIGKRTPASKQREVTSTIQSQSEFKRDDVKNKLQT